MTEPEVWTRRGGREVAVFLTADEPLGVPPTIAVEVAFAERGPRLPVLDMEPAVALKVAETLRDLAEAARSGRRARWAS